MARVNGATPTETMLAACATLGRVSLRPNERSAIRCDITEEYGSLSFEWDSERGIYVREISTAAAHRESGVASRMLARVCALADEAGADVTLLAGPYVGSEMSLERLVAWYEKRGFEVEQMRPAKDDAKMRRRCRREYDIDRSGPLLDRREDGIDRPL